VPTALQFICKKCRSLVDVQTFETTREGIYYCVCINCKAKNAVVQTGATTSQPGILPVTRLLD
jgi:hypothetical protein